jgi:hypothetical protein
LSNYKAPNGVNTGGYYKVTFFGFSIFLKIAKFV